MSPFEPSIDALSLGLIIGLIIVALLEWWFLTHSGIGGNGSDAPTVS